MTQDNHVKTMLNIKDDNIYFYDNCVEIVKIKGRLIILSLTHPCTIPYFLLYFRDCLTNGIILSISSSFLMKTL